MANFIVEDRIWTLLARQCAGEATPVELQELEQLLAQDPVLKSTAEKMVVAWQDPGSNHMQKALTSFARIDAQIQQKEVLQNTEPIPLYHLPGSSSLFKKYSVLFASLAACLVLLAGTWVALFRHNAEPKALALQEITSPKKSIRKVNLPDGSKVWLNEASKMGYTNAFNNKIREVWLTGEAFFDVVKNKEKPFIIHANKINVKVLGTTFNIKSYPGEKSVETSLVRGSVEITLNDEPDKKYILKPNQKLLVPVNQGTLTGPTPDHSGAVSGVRFVPLSKIADKQADSIIAETSWVEGKLAFYESSFKDLSIQLGRRYNISFVFRDKRKENLVFTGMFYKQTLAETLHALSLTAPFDYRIQDDTVYILK